MRILEKFTEIIVGCSHKNKEDEISLCDLCISLIKFKKKVNSIILEVFLSDKIINKINLTTEVELFKSNEFVLMESFYFNQKY